MPQTDRHAWLGGEQYWFMAHSCRSNAARAFASHDRTMCTLFQGALSISPAPSPVVCITPRGQRNTYIGLDQAR